MLNIINKDLHIPKIKIESDEHFYSRIIYSAIGLWIRTSALDCELSDNICGVSKNHITRRCTEILKQLLEYSKKSNNWFYNENISNPIKIITSRMLSFGELLDIGFSQMIGLPEHRTFNLSDCNLSVVQSYPIDFCNGFASGLIWLEPSYKNEIHNAYFLEANDYINGIIKNIKWEKCLDLSSIEIFNYFLKSSLSNSWESINDSNIDMLSVARRNLCVGNYEYYFIRKTDTYYEISGISSFYIMHNDVRRIMYAFRAIHKNKSYAICNVLDVNYIGLRLFSKLPEYEEKKLMGYGWPQKGIDDCLEIIFPYKLKNWIKQTLDNCYITMQEDK